VLGLPPAFVLSQDQTLKLTWRVSCKKRHTDNYCLHRVIIALDEQEPSVVNTTERRLRIPFVRLFTMSKKSEVLLRNRLVLAENLAAPRTDCPPPLGSGGRFLRGWPHRVKQLFAEKISMQKQYVN
jgi:hypothetical protein